MSHALADGAPSPGKEEWPAGVPEVKSAVRTMRTLELLAERFGRPTRLRDVADALGAPRSSTYALLRTLVSSGWVRTDSTGTFYTLGIRALLVGTAFIDADPYVRVVRPVLVEVSEMLNETVHLARLDGADVVYLVTQETRREIRAVSRVGRRLPCYATGLGKSILAERPDAIPSELRPVTSATVTDHEVLGGQLTEARSRGYAVDNEENTDGLRCFGFALHYTDPVTDAISCSVPIDRLDAGREAEIVRVMEEARERIERVAPLQGTF